MPYGLPSEKASNSRNIAATALRAAILHLRRGLCPDGTYEGVHEGEIADHQWRLLESWASEQGLVLPESFFQGLREGGSEHDVRFDQATNRWFKFTRPGCPGYAVELIEGRLEMFLATPLQYLERWYFGNDLFGDDACLVGLRKLDRGFSIAISQPHVRGEDATWEEIDHFMIDILKKKRLVLRGRSLGGYESRAYFGGRIGVFDARPPNCVRTEAGIVVPIDVITQYFRRRDATELERLAC